MQNFTKPLTIGNVTLHSRVLQSPLSGVTDLVFRRLVRRYAPDSMLYTEMISATDLHHMKALPKLMEIDRHETPISIQLFDCRPDFLAEAAQKAVLEGADTVDINMGCPVNKITKKGGGSSLLRQPELASQIVRSVVEAVDIPVTVKTRIGWDDNEITILDFAKRMEDAGAKMITVHARTRSQGYTGNANWEWIRKVKEILTIPVIANGDIFFGGQGDRLSRKDGSGWSDVFAGDIGLSLLVGQVDHFLKTGEYLPEPTVIECLEVAKEHLQGLWDYKGIKGIHQSRKHMTWYAKGFAGAAVLRDRLCRIESLQDGLDCLDGAIKEIAKSSLLE